MTLKNCCMIYTGIYLLTEMLAELSLLLNICIQPGIRFRTIYSCSVITQIYYAFIYHIMYALLHILFISYNTG